MPHPPVYPHGPLEQIGESLYAVRGSIRMNAMVRITRNMGVVKNGNELTLVNPIRVNEQGLKSLDALGTVKHIVRLGAFHGAIRGRSGGW